MFFRGVKTGFFMQLVNMVSIILSLFISNYVSVVIADYIKIWPEKIGINEYEIFNKLFYNRLNQIAWFLVIFVVVLIIFLIIKSTIKVVQKMPLLKEISQIFGGLLGILFANLWVLLVIFVLNLPIIPNGHNYVNKTFLKNIKDINATVMGDYITPILETEDFNGLIKKIEELNEEDKSWLREWLENNNIEDWNLEDILKSK